MADKFTEDFLRAMNGKTTDVSAPAVSPSTSGADNFTKQYLAAMGAGETAAKVQTPATPYKLQTVLNPAAKPASVTSTNTATSQTTAPKTETAKQTTVAPKNATFWEKLGLYLSGNNDTTLPNVQANDSSELIAENLASGAVESAKGAVNLVNYYGQGAMRGKLATAEAQQKADAAITGSKGSAALADNFKQTREAQEAKGLTTAVDWGKGLKKDIAERSQTADKATLKIGEVANTVGRMVPSMVSNAVLPGSSLLVMGAGAAGNAIEQAKAEGASDAGALTYGTAVGAIEAATEKMFDGVFGVFGKGVADDAVEKLVTKYVKSGTAQNAILTLISMLGEGAEEFVAEVTENWMNRLTAKTDDRRGLDLLSDAGKSAAMGALVSALFQGAQVMQRGDKITAAQIADNAVAAIDGGRKGNNAASSILPENHSNNTAKTDTNVSEGSYTPETPATPKTPINSVENQQGTQTARGATAVTTQDGVETPQSATQAVAEGNAAKTVDSILSGDVSNSKAESIISDPALRQAFEEKSGEKLTGTKSEMRGQIKDYAAALKAQREIAAQQGAEQEKTQAPQSKGELPSGMGAASRNSLGGMGPTKPTRFDINDQHDVDLTNLPAMSNQVNMTPQPRTGRLKTWLNKAYTDVVDKLNPIAKFSKATGDNTAMFASNSMNAGGTVSHIFETALVDMNGNKIGASLKDVAKDIPKGQEADFWNYMMQRRNINRAAMDTNVISNYNSQMSKQYVENIEAQHPEWKKIGDDIVQWLRDFENAWSVDSGLVDSAIMHNMQNADPDYIPAQREFSEVESTLTGGDVGRKFVDLSSPIKKMQGSERDINNPLENIMRLVNTTVKTARYNQVGQSMLNTLRNNPMPQYAEIVSEDEAKASKANNIVSVFENGKKQYIKINDVDLLKSLEGIPESTYRLPIVSGLTQTFKNLVTQQNPLFGLTNFARDLPTGYIYGSQSNPFSYLVGEAKAFWQIAGGKESFQRYKAVGGGMSSFFSSANAETAALNLTKTKNVFQKIGVSFEKFNSMIEEATRLNEFNAVFAKTGDVQKALYAANDVTVNFTRGGDVTKTIDRNGVPYLNAAIQGMDKLGKAFMPEKIAKTLLTGTTSIMLPQLILYMFNRRNPYYDELSNRTKDTYFCIPNMFGEKDDNGNPMTFIKIPKSRELGMIFGSLAERIARAVDEEEEAFKGYAGALATNIAPANPLDSGIIGPFVGLRSNKDFAGRTIVPQSMQNRSPHLQYDEKTSELTKFIAEYLSKAGIEWSPKKMDYIIDSWTGVVGDFLLPITTKGANALSPVTNRFVADPRYSNQTLSDFYDKMEKAAQLATDKNFAEGLDSDTVTLEEKVSNNYSKASKEITALSKVSNRAGVEKLTADDKKLLKEYGISTSGTPQDIQKAIRSAQIEIARDAMGRGTRSDEMELDINNDSGIAKAVEKYQGAGISQKQAYSLYKAMDALVPETGKSEVSSQQKAKVVVQQGYGPKQTAALVGSLWNQSGAEEKKTLLPSLNVAQRLVTMYVSGGDSKLVSMTVPRSFSENSVTYTLTDAEMELFQTTYADYFNRNANNVMSEENLLRLREDAYNRAKYAVLRGRK